MTRGRAIGAGFLAGAIAGLVMTLVMLLLAWAGVATPLAIMGDRLSVFIPADAFLSLMGRVGGYNHMKQLGVGSVIAGQLIVGGFGGTVYGLVMRRRDRNRFSVTAGLFILLPLFAVTVLLWPVLGTNYRGFPIGWAAWLTLAGLLLAFLAFERTMVLGFRFITREREDHGGVEFSPALGRRALLFSGFGLIIAGGSAALLRTLFKLATFGYDGTQYKGREVEAITPNDRFYCVTKNVIDPCVDVSLWRLEVSGLVKTPRVYGFEELKALPAVEQETTLMCISNGIDAGLMSNALWKGVPLMTLLDAATPVRGAAKVRLHGVDNYADTFPLQKAVDRTTLIAYEMNGQPLPDRHGFPARAIVPGYFGEKHVKWITRIELAGPDAIGFYEKQGWGPNFIVPTRSRIDQPDHEAIFNGKLASKGILVRGVAFGGDRGISQVEVTFDDGKIWQEARLDYPGTKLTWALWSYAWHPERPGDYVLVVRATDGEGALQEWEEDRPFKSGVTGFHKIKVHITA